MARTAVLLAVALLFAGTPATQPSGTIAGTVLDARDAALPGTTISVISGQIATLNFALGAGCPGHVYYIDNGLRWVINRSDLIAHIRIPAVDVPAACPSRPTVNHCACALHNASVLGLLKGEMGDAQQLRLIQDGAGVRGEESPYGPGDEFIAFLKLDVSARAFTRVSGPLYMFRVRNGRIDLEGRTLTGVTDGERTVVTDTRGAFSFYDVPPGRYAVIASLHGFYSLPHTDVAISPGGSATLTFELWTDCMRAPDDATDPGLAEVRNEADLIAHIRIPALVPPTVCAMESHCSCTLHHATVVRVIRGQPLRELRLLQEGAGYATREQPYAAGDEFIAFLKRDDKNHAFARTNGPRYIFRVRDGRVDLAGRSLPGFTDGMSVAEFERALRAVR